jgi:hypothetical protein
MACARCMPWGLKAFGSEHIPGTEWASEPSPAGNVRELVVVECRYDG